MRLRIIVFLQTFFYKIVISCLMPLVRIQFQCYRNMTSGEGEKWASNKELLIIPDAVHTDLYDNLDVIPFDIIEGFILKSVE